MSESKTTHAVVLRWRAYGESDKIATVLTRDFGKLTGIAKGARRSRRRFVNSLEPLARVNLHFRQKPHASLAFLESATLREPMSAILEPVRFAYAHYLIELTDQLTEEGHPVADLHDLLDSALACLENRPATSAFLRAFEVHLLTCSGYQPQLRHCSGCDRQPLSDERVAVDATRGIFFCHACPNASIVGSVETPMTILRVISELESKSIDESSGLSLGADAAAAARLTGDLLSAHLRRPLQSLQMIAQVAPRTIVPDGS